MSIIVSVKIHDGMVMAADSVTTFYKADGTPGQIYEHTDKIVNLVRGLPIGVMTCGAGSVGNASIATLLKDLRTRMMGEQADAEWALSRENYTMEHVASQVQRFFSEKATEAKFKGWLMLRICGYSSARDLPESWQVLLKDDSHPAPTCIESESTIGLQWEGEHEALNRLVYGLGNGFIDAASGSGITKEQAEEAKGKISKQLFEPLIVAAAPIQDAIDLARFMVETTKGFIRFSIKRAKTVGGPVEIAAITKHEGFKWVQRKHFYDRALNPWHSIPVHEHENHSDLNDR